MAFAPTGSGGSRALYGIFVRLDASGVVTGATIVNQSMGKIKTTARRAAKSIDGVTKSSKDMQQQAMQASAGLASVGFALAMTGKKVLGLAGHATRSAMGFEAAMSRVKFATKATASDMKMLTGVMMKLGRDTIETPTSAAEAFRQLRTAGLDTKEALNLLPKTIQLVTGAGGLIDMNTAVRASVSAIKKFAGEGVSFQKVMDTMANATRTTALSWENMAPFLNSLRAAPLLMQSSMATMMALGGVMKAGGMQAAQAGEAVSILSQKLIGNSRIISNFMTKKGLKTKDEFMEMNPKLLRRRMISFQQMRVDLFDEAGKIRDINVVLAESLGKYQELLASGGDEEALQGLTGVFGQKAGAMVLMLKKLTEEGVSASDMLSELSSKVDDAAGSLDDAEKSYLRTAEGVERLIKGSKLTIATIFGNSTLKIVERALTAYKKFLNTMLQVTEENPALAKAVMVTTAAFGALAYAAGAAAVVMGAALFWTQVLGPAMLAVGGPAGALKKGFAGLLMVLKSLIIPGLILAGVFVLLLGAFAAWNWIQTSSDGLAKRLKHNFDMIKLVAQGVIEWWNGKGGPNSNMLFEKLEKNGLKDFVVIVLQVKWVVTKLFEGIGKALMIAWKGFVMFFYIVGDVIAKFMEIMGLGFGSAQASDIRVIGDALVAFGSIIGGFLVAKMVIFAAQTLIAIGRVAALGTAGLLASIKMFGLVIAIVAALAAYTALILYMSSKGSEAGASNWEWMDATAIWFNKLALKFKEAGHSVFNYFKEGFSNGWMGWLKWLWGQMRLIWALVKTLFGGTFANVAKVSKEIGLSGRAGTPELATDRIAELATRAREGHDPSGQYEKAKQEAEDDASKRKHLAQFGLTLPSRVDDTFISEHADPRRGSVGSNVGKGNNTMGDVTIIVKGSVTDENAKVMGQSMVEKYFDSDFQTSFQP